MNLKSRARLVSATIAIAVTLIGSVAMGGPANAATTQPSAPGVTASNIAKVAALQSKYAKTATPTEYSKATALYNQLLSSKPVAKQAAAVGTESLMGPAAYACVTIYRWQIEAIGWVMVAQGVVVGALGGFIDLTIIGIPVGAVLNALGLGQGASGAFVIWWADTQFPDHRRVCIHW